MSSLCAAYCVRRNVSASRLNSRRRRYPRNCTWAYVPKPSGVTRCSLTSPAGRFGAGGGVPPWFRTLGGNMFVRSSGACLRVSATMFRRTLSESGKSYQRQRHESSFVFIMGSSQTVDFDLTWGDANFIIRSTPETPCAEGNRKLCNSLYRFEQTMTRRSRTTERQCQNALSGDVVFAVRRCRPSSPTFMSPQC